MISFLFHRRHVLIYVLLWCVVGSLFAATTWSAGKWVTTAGLLMDIAGLVQLEISVFYKMNLDAFSDEEKYPYGVRHQHL
jgi:hypothetical protein